MITLVVKEKLVATAEGVGGDIDCLVISGSSVDSWSPCNLLLIIFGSAHVSTARFGVIVVVESNVIDRIIQNLTLPSRLRYNVQ
jgi:hypothetical protein